MITKKMLRIYKRFDGDGDGFVRTGTKQEKDLFQTDDWSTITCIIQDLEIIKKDLCSLAFKENVYAILESQFDLEAQEELKK
jgi:hypothetical protein